MIPARVLLVGATGRLGLRVAGLLRARGMEVRALLRASAASEGRKALEQLGCQVVAGDLKEEESLGTACASRDIVVSTASAMRSSQLQRDTIDAVDRLGQLSLIAAAERAKVRHIVFTSFPEIDLTFELQSAKRAVETRLGDSILDHTVLRPSYFLEAWFDKALGFCPREGTARIFGDGRRLVSWISIDDVAEAVAVICDSPARHTRRTIDLAGVTYSQLEILEVFARLGATPFKIDVTSDQARLQRYFEESTGGPVQARAAMALTLARGLVVASKPAETLLGRDLRTPHQFAVEFLQQPF